MSSIILRNKSMSNDLTSFNVSFILVLVRVRVLEKSVCSAVTFA